MVFLSTYCFLVLQKFNMRKFTSVGLSLPIELAQKVDSDRGEVTRSRFLTKIVRKYYENAVEAAQETK
jgi:metal-responsive CopG/Arc/MetJ family transcriptional regulator